MLNPIEESTNITPASNKFETNSPLPEEFTIYQTDENGVFQPVETTPDGLADTVRQQIDQ